MNAKYYPIGYIVARLQQPPACIEGAITELGIEPALTLNGLAYYDQARETEIDELLRRRKAERILGRPIPSEVKS